VSRRTKRPQADHYAAAQGLREQPGVERLVHTYPAGLATPDRMAAAIRKGEYHPYTPAGAYEARTAPVGDDTGLYVRYLGKAGELRAEA
jgi:hypothetical protein